MENCKLARFTYGGLCIISSISSTSTFNQICIDLCSRFKGLRIGWFELRYGLNEDPNCVLDCDADVLNMLMVFYVIEKSIVEILVIDKCDDSMVQLPTENTSSSYRTTDSIIVASENDHLGKYGSHGLNGDDVNAYNNPESIFELEVVPESNRFLHLFITYDAWIKGFIFCHPILFIDDTFIKSKYKRTLLSCCEKNDNDGELIISNFYIGHYLFLFSYCKKMMNLLANCAYTYTPFDFDDCMTEFKDNGQGYVKNFLCDLPKENNVIPHFPDIRVRLMGSMAEKRIFGQNIHTILTCSCVQWQYNCFPCSHALQVLQHDNHYVFYYIDDYWKTSFYQKRYQFGIHPFSDLEKPNIPFGRPKKTKIKFTGEISGSEKDVTCSRCGCSRHNKVSCKVVIQVNYLSK
ncbi:hypothetical protein D8674_009347 [Pyrus ussuriensis x Pyrus communis]|uniref:SWIM-type domain-containing protein n=1 Tax=Pyrus ussuriensis x Pyrus communis TaxID=2448454 RepID=A0A5N5F7P3_9ROSA|nr:hypothetical protein D8674_009347 [Pyrus ussuriensis x Pyrus communis]